MSVFDSFARLLEGKDICVYESADPTRDEATTADSSRDEAATADPSHQQCALSYDELKICAPFTEERIAEYERDAKNLSEGLPPQFSPIEPTTFGLNGYIRGISFIEETLIAKLRTIGLRYPCVRATCNYGTVCVPEFDDMVERGIIDMSSDAKAERAREKKLARRIKPRKVQGSGKCFNSSILVWIHSAIHNVVYKVLLFRTGTFGLPGARPIMLRDIIDIFTDKFLPQIANALDVAQGSVALEYLAPIMKNYKWKRYLEPGTTIDLARVHSAISSAMLSEANAEVPFSIGHAYHEVCDSKLSVKFNVFGCKNRGIRIKIFMYGRINILGACDSRATKMVCEFIARILSDDVIKNNDSDMIASEMTEEERSMMTMDDESANPAPADALNDPNIPRIIMFH